MYIMTTDDRGCILTDVNIDGAGEKLTVLADSIAEVNSENIMATDGADAAGAWRDNHHEVNDDTTTEKLTQRAAVTECSAAAALCFNLSSEEGQKHLRDLNAELKALNEEGVSVLHNRPEHCKDTVAKSRPCSTPKKKSRKRKNCDSLPGPDVRKSSTSKQNKCAKKFLLDAEEEYSGISLDAAQEIDSILEEKAWRANLSAINVKNILRYVVTNEHVLSMVRNSMKSSETSAGDSAEEGDIMSEACYEPKLTRSKAKELIEMQAKVPWPISPIKPPLHKKRKKLIELEFSESEATSDEEYNPSKELDSEEEDSFLSSQPSEEESKGTPDAKANLEKKIHNAPDDERSEEKRVEKQKRHFESELTTDEEMQPDRSDLEKNFNSSRTSEVESPKVVPGLVSDEGVHSAVTTNEDVSEDTIALRTRSKFSLNNTPLEHIESNLIAPDITMDMYESQCDDEDWQNFLNEFLKPLNPNPAEVPDDDANDPEYNFLEEEDVPDSEDLRNDRAVRISKKEIHDLVAELFEAAHAELTEGEGDEDFLKKEPLTDSDGHSKEQNKRTPDVEDTEVLFSDDMKKELDEQMRQHVQLLTQVFLLSSGVAELDDLRSTCRALLVELQNLASNSQAHFGGRSRFAAHNLEAAVGIVDLEEENSGGSPVKTSTESKSPSVTPRCRITDDMAKVISSSEVFMYTNLLPVGGFRLKPVSKHVFTEAEDNLLALGLDQFSKLKLKESYWTLIRDNMLPVKTVKQIRIRAKNLRCSKAASNPVKHFYQFKKAPVMTHSVKTFDPSAVKPPAKQQLKLLPDWLETYIQWQSVSPRRRKLVLPRIKPRLPPASNHSGSAAKEQLQSAEAAAMVEDEAAVTQMGEVSKPLSATPTETEAAVSSTSDFSPASPDRVPAAVQVSRTPEKRRSASSLSMPLVAPGASVALTKLSPLKQVSPILKKYSGKGLRKTGGNLKNKKKQPLPILPKVIFVSTGKRPLAPKVAAAPSAPKDTRSTAVENGRADGGPPECAGAPVAACRTREDFKAGDTLGSSTGRDCSAGAKYPNSDPESEVEVEPFDDGDDTADDEGIDMQADNEDDLAALMAASTTIMSTPKHRQNMFRKKKKKQEQDREDLLALLAEDLIESDPLKEERETAFVQAYLLKVKEAVGDDVCRYEDFLRLLHLFNQKEGNPVQLYRDVCVMLRDFPPLCEEFVFFLLPEQALECGKFMEHLSFTKMQVFLRKLEVHFGKHPPHLQKILKLLYQLQNQENLTIEELRLAMSPVLRGQKHLIEEFLQLFPSAIPPESSMTDFEEVVIPDGDEEIPVDDDDYEVVELPESEDVYGTKDCICECHNSSDEPKVQNRLRHCLRCGIKFIDGRIFLQTGKVLKPLRIVYHSLKEKQVTADGKSSRSATRADEVFSPLSSVSTLSPPPSKDSDDEHAVPPRGSVAKEAAEDADRPTNPFLEALEQISQEQGTRCNLPSASATEDAILTSDVSTNHRAPVPADFSILRKVISNGNAPTTTIEFEIHHGGSGDRATVYVRSPIEDASSEDAPPDRSSGLRPQGLCTTEENASMPISSVSSAKNHTVDGEGKVIVLWTREYDRVLLRSCQQMGASKATFEAISAKLQTKTPEEIEERFHELVKLFAQDTDTNG